MASVLSQESRRPVNSVYVSLAGDGALFTVNYDRQVFITPDAAISARLGLGYQNEFCFDIFCPSDEKFIVVAHHLTANIGDGEDFFEFGLGGRGLVGKERQHLLIYPVFGYRSLPFRSGRLNLRLTVHLPFPGFYNEDFLFIPFGAGMGVSF